MDIIDGHFNAENTHGVRRRLTRARKTSFGDDAAHLDALLAAGEQLESSILDATHRMCFDSLKRGRTLLRAVELKVHASVF